MRAAWHQSHLMLSSAPRRTQINSEFVSLRSFRLLGRLDSEHLWTAAQAAKRTCKLLNNTATGYWHTTIHEHPLQGSDGYPADSRCPAMGSAWFPEEAVAAYCNCSVFKFYSRASGISMPRWPRQLNRDVTLPLTVSLPRSMLDLSGHLQMLKAP